MYNSLTIFSNKTPFIKLLVPFIAGILLQWYLQCAILFSIILFGIAFTGTLLFWIASLYVKYKWRWLQAALLHVILFTVGMMLIYLKDIRHQPGWFGKQYTPGKSMIVVLKEDPVEKVRSYKAEARVVAMLDKKVDHVSGNIICYFKKDSTLPNQIHTGSRILFKQTVQEIKNSGNPGAFDYKTYALRNGITHQVYLGPDHYRVITNDYLNYFSQALYRIKRYVLNTISSNITGAKERGLAEALLIGYKDDLDKNLLQSYTNTGVVHVIAVSGMHLALIYWILDLLFSPLLKRKTTRWLHPVLVLSVLWLFSLVTGGAASIMRAAVMFSFIMIGKTINRHSSIYNTLAASAFCLLCYNPFWLWDVGFQLSYAAVLSIVIFYKPIYDLVYVRNKILDYGWQLIAVSIAAQILTTPLSIYYFHQFPIYFLLTNLVAVPVSSVILIAELVLVILSPIKMIVTLLGKITAAMIWWLNTSIEQIEKFPFALWTGLQVSVVQTILLFVIIAGISFWLLHKWKPGFFAGITAFALFTALRAYSFYTAQVQEKLIVYAVPKAAVVSFVQGRRSYIISDTMISKNTDAYNYNIKPATVLFRTTDVNSLEGVIQRGNALLFHNKKILFVNQPLHAASTNPYPLNTDVIILSGNPRLYIADLFKNVNAKQIVISSSVPAWKARYWKRDCDSLHIPCYDVNTAGAFVMNLR